jgi:hypothetical protein
MGVRAFGSSSEQRDIEGRISGGPAAEPNIFNLGSVATGDEHTFDSTDSGESSDDSGENDRVVDPASIPDTGDRDAPYGRFPDGRARKRRAKGSGGNGGGRTTARPAGTRKTASEVSSFVADCFQGIHEIGARISGIEELEMSEDESKAMGEAIVRVTEQYDVPMPDAKTMAWINLIKVLGIVYGPRITAVKIRKGREKAAKRQPSTRPFQMPNVGVGVQ